jgi:hypothetical protein
MEYALGIYLETHRACECVGCKCECFPETYCAGHAGAPVAVEFELWNVVCFAQLRVRAWWTQTGGGIWVILLGTVARFTGHTDKSMADKVMADRVMADRVMDDRVACVGSDVAAADGVVSYRVCVCMARDPVLVSVVNYDISRYV